eukprot:UC4_evm9s1211
MMLSTHRNLIISSALCCTALFCTAAYASPPEQVHIAQGGMGYDKITISFVTTEQNPDASVYIGTDENSLDRKVEHQSEPETYSFVSHYSPDKTYTSGYIHHIVVDELQADKKYFYKCGTDHDGWTPVFNFKTGKEIAATSTAVFALSMDIGQTNYSAATMRHILEDETITAMIIAGDLSYADSAEKNTPSHPCSQERWDTWGRMIEPLTSHLPTMTCPGNHEIEQEGPQPATQTEFLAYMSRFKMPWEESHGDRNSLYYSFNYGAAHWIMLNSYMDVDSSSPQYKWLLSDLQAVNKKVTPWLFVSFHAPWYNSNSHHHNEVQEYEMRDAMEELLHQHEVDAVFAGHVHNYERTHNVYKNETSEGAAVYITVGDGGNREGPATGWFSKPDWTAFRQDQSEEPERVFGHGRLEIFNSTHAGWEWHQLYDDELAKTDIGDSVMFVKNSWIGKAGGRGVTVVEL